MQGAQKSSDKKRGTPKIRKGFKRYSMKKEASVKGKGNKK
jgi:hypothetical protein